MLKYFTIDDYSTLDSATKLVVDQWLESHELMESGITLLQQTSDNQLIAAGFTLDEIGHMVGDDIVVKAVLSTDDFPWETVEKNLLEVANSEIER